MLRPYHVRRIPFESPHVPSRVANFCCYRRSCRRICSSCRREPARRRSSFKGSKEWRTKCMWVYIYRAFDVRFKFRVGGRVSRGTVPVKLRKNMALIISVLQCRWGFISDGRRDNSDARKKHPHGLSYVRGTKADKWNFVWYQRVFFTRFYFAKRNNQFDIVLLAIFFCANLSSGFIKSITRDTFIRALISWEIDSQVNFYRNISRYKIIAFRCDKLFRRDRKKGLCKNACLTECIDRSRKCNFFSI